MEEDGGIFERMSVHVEAAGYAIARIAMGLSLKNTFQ